MNWEAIGAIGEIVGATGVILTLMYLSVQIRQSTRASKASTAQQFSNNWINLNLFYAHEADQIGEISLADPDLTELQKQKSSAFWRALTHQWSNSYYQYRQGNLDDELFAQTEREVRGYLSDPRLRAHLEVLWWGEQAHGYNDAFDDFLRQILADLDRDDC